MQQDLLLKIYQAKAKKIGFEVRPSTTKGKKLDVYQGQRKVASIGAKGYADYEIYKLNNGLQAAKHNQLAL